jgi:hypothetical protein
MFGTEQRNGANRDPDNIQAEWCNPENGSQ